MHTRFHGQRQHIIYSLDSLIYQLFTLSFFLSPSLWIYICRIVSQFQYSRPRELDPTGSLRLFYGLVFLLNVPIMWSHVMRGAVEGRVIILDFIGMSYVPTKAQLFFLDFVIVTLQLLLTTVAYETSVYYGSSDAEPEDPLLPDLTPHFTIPMFQQLPQEDADAPTPPLAAPKQTLIPDIPLVVDLQLKPVLAHLRNPPPPAQVAPTITLPSDNGSWPLPVPGMRMLMRARRQIRGTTTAEIVTPQAELPAPTRERRVPGALDPEPL